MNPVGGQSGDVNMLVTAPVRGAVDRILRKEVIQPQVPLRLPCYDLVPIRSLAVAAYPPCGLDRRLRALLPFVA